MLPNFISDYGVPEHFTFGRELVNTDIKNLFNQLIHNNGIDHHQSSPMRPY